MARDLRQPRLGTNRCLYYEGKYVNNMKLEQDAQALGVFYAGVKSPFIETMQNNNNLAHITIKGQIETNDFVPNLKVNSYVLFKGGLYVVEEVSRSEKPSNTFNTRKAKTTYIKLRR